MQRGDIYWVALPTPKGSEPGYRRPLVIVQAEKLNRSSFPTVMVCPLTSNLDLAAAPGNVLIKAGESGLTRDSVVQVQQIITVNKANLKLQAGSIPGHLMLAVDMGLAGSLDLE